VRSGAIDGLERLPSDDVTAALREIVERADDKPGAPLVDATREHARKALLARPQMK
jgi:hypothetical protein